MQSAEVGCRTDLIQSRSDVVDAGNDRSEIRHHILAVQADNERRNRDHDQIRHEKGVDRAHDLMLDALTVHFVHAHQTRMNQRHHFLLHTLEQQQDARAFHAAAGRTGTRADEHQQHDQQLAERRPLVEIHGRKAGGRDDGRNLKQGMMEALAQRTEVAAYVESNQRGEHGDNAEVHADLLDFEHLLEFAGQNQEISVEIDTEQDHKHRNDILQIRAVVVRDGVIPVAEAAGAGRAERNADGIEHRHATDQQQNDLQNGQSEVNRIENQRGIAHMRRNFGDRGTRAFRTHQVNGLAAGQRQHDQHEHQDAHAADPVHQAAP